MKKHFNKNLIMTEEEEHLFKKSNSCWICKKLIDNIEENVRDHSQVTGKFRGAAHRNCNIKFQLTKKVPVIFNNLMFVYVCVCVCVFVCVCLFPSTIEASPD